MNDNWVKLGDVIKKLLEEYIEDETERNLIEEAKAPLSSGVEVEELL